jgi:trans-aconitate methyltransferase
VSDQALPQWDAETYSANRTHHQVHDEAFLATLPLQPDDRVLDIGCGSGELTSVVATLVPDGHVVGLDGSPSMIEAATAKGTPNQSFVLGPAQQLGPLLTGEAFDGIYSRAALHWVPPADWPAMLRATRDLLTPDGWLRIECGGGDNVAAPQQLLDDISASLGGPQAPWNFLPAGGALDLLETAGFALGGEDWVRTVAQRRAFDRDGVLGWLRSQCENAYLIGLRAEQHEAFRSAVTDRVDELRRADGTYDVTFVRLDLLVTALAV